MRAGGLNGPRSPARLAGAALVAIAVLAAGTVAPTQFLGSGGEAEADHGSFVLSVIRTGNGTVTSDPAGIACGSDCSETYDHAKTPAVRLIATPEPGRAFLGWGGACSGKAACSVNMTASQQVSASFTGAAPSPSPSPGPSPTPSPAPVATPSPGPAPPPKVRLAYKKTQSLGEQGGALLLRVLCGKPCRTHVSGSVVVPQPGTSAVYRLRTQTKSLKGGRRVRFTLRLSRRARRAVKRRASRKHPARARLRVLSRSSGTKPRVLKRRIALLP